MIEVAVGILKQNGSVLLCQRKGSVQYPFQWEFPGGKLETGESPVDCLKRELREELSIVIGAARLFHREATLYPASGHFDVHYFLVEEFAGVPQNNCFEQIAWVRLSDLPSYDNLEGNRRVIDLLTSNG